MISNAYLYSYISRYISTCFVPSKGLIPRPFKQPNETFNGRGSGKLVRGQGSV